MTLNIPKIISFPTSDLYLVSALTLAGYSPDSTATVEDSSGRILIQFIWHDRQKIPLDDILNGTLKFSYAELKKMHQEYRNQVLDITQK